MCLLFVNAEALIVLLATSWLEDLREIALNATEALAKFGSDPYVEVLLTDVNMPGVSGYQLARAKDMRPSLKVVLLSGAESDPRGWPLLRKPFLTSDSTRTMAQVGVGVTFDRRNFRKRQLLAAFPLPGLVLVGGVYGIESR